MKINIVNDLHLDMGPCNPTLPGGEVLVIAGDMCEARHYRKHVEDVHGYFDDPEIKISNKDRINRFLVEECAEKYDHVIYVAGNHEHYHGVFDKTIQKIKDNVPDNFHVLDNDCFELEDVMFLGATMWTDCNKQDPMTIHAIKDMMTDFQVIRKIRGADYTRFKPQDTINEHFRTLQYFKMMMELPQNVFKKTVIVTHHAPTHLSIDPKYISQYLMNGAYHSRLDDLILDHPQIKYWFHGHMHDAKDYMVGDYTRVICNPRGYQTRAFQEETNWDPNLTVEI